MIAFVSALGYGLGYEIPKLLGWPDWQCLAVCLVAGFAMDCVVGSIIFSRAIQKKPAYRFLAFALFIVIFLAVQHIAMSWLGVSMLRRQYGDGSNGFVFDEALKTVDLDEVNRQNRPIRGAYDTGLAVKTKTGTYVGVKEKNIIYYSGIPYAKPPVGERRWKAPEPLPESEAVFEAQPISDIHPFSFQLRQSTYLISFCRFRLVSVVARLRLSVLLIDSSAFRFH